MARFFLMTFAATTLLSACGGETIDQVRVLTSPGTEAFIAHGEELDRLNVLSNSAFSAVVSGTAEFDGSATVVIFTGSETQTIVGDASIQADLLRSTITGGLTDFEGVENDVDYDGSLTLTSGVIGGERPNTFESDVSGALTSDDGGNLIINGSVDGVFKGTPVQGLVANGTTNLTIINGSGTTSPSLISIVAEEVTP